MILLALGALSAALAIGAGAFGAHGAANPQAAEYLRLGGMYQLVHAVAVVTLGGRAGGAAWLLLVGAAVFSGTLYLMAVGCPKWLGAVTPIGGTLMIAGWLWAAWGFLRG